MAESSRFIRVLGQNHPNLCFMLQGTLCWAAYPGCGPGASMHQTLTSAAPASASASCNCNALPMDIGGLSTNTASTSRLVLCSSCDPDSPQAGLGCRYFTWDKAHFPTPEKMQGQLADTGRKMVAIIDPHIKLDDKYYVYSEAKRLGHLVKNKDGNDFDGCVPQTSGQWRLVPGQKGEAKQPAAWLLGLSTAQGKGADSALAD